jgi:hypothetical protein
MVAAHRGSLHAVGVVHHRDFTLAGYGNHPGVATESLDL